MLCLVMSLIILFLVNTHGQQAKTKNFAVVAGEGEGTARRTRAVGNTRGLDRKELFVDARDLSSNDGEITDDEYNKSLDERGGEKLAEVKPIVKFEGEVLLDGNYVYKQDFNLGDVVTVENKKYGVFINTRIIEILESEDENGYVITPTFGEQEVYVWRKDLAFLTVKMVIENMMLMMLIILQKTYKS